MREQCEKQRLGIHPTLLPPPGKRKRKKETCNFMVLNSSICH